jgi:hypothetical protein
MPGDTVLVAPGTYLENIVWPSTQDLCLVSEAGRDVTIIDGSNPSNPDSGSVVLFVTGLDEGTVLRGFTITGGTGTLDVDPPYAYYGGGGIFCNGSSPTIADNLITGNTNSQAGGAGGGGGGIACGWGASPLIVSNRIEGNAVSGPPPNYSIGGGIECYLSSPTIRANVISGNTAHAGGGLRIGHDSFPTITGNEITDNDAGIVGGGIQIAFNSAPVITHNWIRGNAAATGGGGIACYDPSTPTDPYFAYNILTENEAPVGGGVHLGLNCTPTIEHCAIYANVGDGVLCEGGSNPDIRQSDIFDHGPYYGVRNITPSLTISAENNWWGHSSGPYHPVTNPGGLGDLVSDFVDYEPWSTISVGVGEAMAQPPPAQFVLRQNRPNPFNPVTMIEFSLPQSSQVVLRVYNVLGREIVTLVDEVKAVGTHRTSWDASNVASGVYFYRIEADGWTATRSMVVAR